MAGKITLTFNQEAVSGNTIVVNIDDGTVINALSERFGTTRWESGIVQLPSNNNTKEKSAEAYAQAFSMDNVFLGGLANITATSSGNIVTINMNEPSWQFDSVTGGMVTQGKVSYVIENEPVRLDDDFKITGFKAGANPCTDAILEATNNGESDVYSIFKDGNLYSEIAYPPFEVNCERGTPFVLKVHNNHFYEDNLVEITVRPPRKIIANDITANFRNLQSGTTINIDVKYISDSILPLNYSLNGTNYQSGNTFTGIAEGEYTIYVKDDFGCVSEKEITVFEYSNLNETVSSISEINALRFAKVEYGKKNHKNTLSSNQLRQISRPFYHKFTNDDVVVTQFKTNAKYIDCFAFDCNGAEIKLAPIKQTENTALEAKSTATYHSLGAGRSALYFGQVSILNVVTDEFVKQSNFGFTLPEWANKEGDLVSIEGIGQIEINKIGYSYFYDSFILEFNTSYSGLPVEKKVYAQYNLQPYEVYEFTFDMGLMPDMFYIGIQIGTSESNILQSYVSEGVKKIIDSDKLFEIDYSHDTNLGSMVYQTDIKHKLRLPGFVEYIGEQDTEGYNGDNEFYVTDNSVYDSERFVFPHLSSEMAHKLRLVMSHENININGLSYKISETPEVEGNINNNFKTFSVLLKRGGDAILSKDQEIISGSSENELIGGGIEASKGKALILWTKQNG